MSTIYRILNPIVKGVLRSPIHHFVSHQMMVITFTGRKTGRVYSTPVSYYQEGNHVYCFTHADWWKNLDGGSEVKLHIRGREVLGEAMPILDNRERKKVSLGKFLTAVPSDAQFFSVKIDAQGNPDADDLERAVDDATMIEIHIDQKSRD